MVRWPDGDVSGGRILNGMVSHLDWFQALVAAAGDPDVKKSLLKGGYEANGKSFRVHLDGYNMLPYLQGSETVSPRTQFIYFNADAQIVRHSI